jgi:cell division protein FtsQ
VNKLEDLLESYSWISNAETYFDNHNVLHISVTEKSPIARIFTVSGHSFYIDSSAQRIPLSGHYTARVPVFTGFPESKKWSIKDSILMVQVKNTAMYIGQHAFWQSQVSQVDIQPDHTLEMIPVIGNHVVLLGEGIDIDKKLKRLFAYYKHVAGKKGFDAYSVLNVQFEGQVIGIRKNESSRNNAEAQRARSLALMQDHYNKSQEIVPVTRDQKPVETEKPKPGKKIYQPEKALEETAVKRIPKAVMPKRENDN